ncbi:arginase family protein [Occultella aeris]|uniref:Arginase n=1 Tax=Occultella aeris TaxID=2761496 RepID=A0A7M4DIF2_9MICO|nr:arginase family protein [Occultella aeris]VZO36725.1 Arginase [Occultella aeris]
MSTFAVISAPSSLGLSTDGVAQLPQALLDAGLGEQIDAGVVGEVAVPPRFGLDAVIGLLNPDGVREFALRLAATTAEVLDSGRVPVILGGDCSIVLGPLLALRRRGRYGLLFIDGHADFYQPAAEPLGEVASMDLALATGRGPSVLADLGGLGPLVRDSDVVQFGRRDAAEAAADGSQRIEDTDILVVDLATVSCLGTEQATSTALAHLDRVDLHGIWVHVDCDVLDDDVMPAVDYRLPGGLGWDDLAQVLRSTFDTGRVVGIDVTIFNPTLDLDGSIASCLVDCLARGLGDPT